MAFAAVRQFKSLVEFDKNGVVCCNVVFDNLLCKFCFTANAKTGRLLCVILQPATFSFNKFVIFLKKIWANKVKLGRQQLVFCP